MAEYILKEIDCSRSDFYISTDKLTPELLSSLEYILHSNEVKEDYIIQYLLGELDKFL